MQEDNRLAVGADLRLGRAEHPGARRDQPVAGGADVVDLVADVVDAALGVAGEEAGDRRALAKWFQKLDFRVRQGDEDDRHAVLGLRQRRGQLRPEHIAVDARSRIEVVDRDRHVAQPSDHALSVPSQISTTSTWQAGFLPQTLLTAERTARATASSTASESRRRAFGRLSSTWPTVSARRSAIGLPRRSLSGTPMMSITGSPAISPRRSIAVTTETSPAKASFRRSGTARSVESMVMSPSL